MPKHIRDKCIENGISSSRNERGTIHYKKAIELGSIWKNETPIKTIK